jgi:hypothetical protein
MDSSNTSNNTNNAVPADYIQGTILTLAVTLGVLGNIPVIASIGQQRRLLKNNHYYLILHLAICDLFFLLFFTPSIYSIFTANPSKTFLCRIWLPTHTMFFTAGANFLVLISLCRYRAIVHPLKPAVSGKVLKALSTFVYVLAMICVVPQMLVLRFDETFGCYEEWTMESLNITYTIFLTSVQYFIPVVFLSVMYFTICRKLLTHNNKLRLMNTQIGQGNTRRRLTLFQRLTFRNAKTFYVSFIIVICFVVSACPAQVIWLVSVIGSKELPSYMRWFEAVYIFGTCAINPYVYGAFDKKVFSLFIKHCRRRTIG